MVTQVFEFDQYNYLLQLKDTTKPVTFLNNLFRGALGFFLHKNFCFCETTQKHEVNCLYQKIFETQSNDLEMSQAGKRTAARPFVFHMQKGRGDFVKFTITLFGTATVYISQIHHCMEHMAKDGIGKDRLTFKIMQVDLNGTDVYQPDNKELIRGLTRAKFAQTLSSQHLRLDFKTPCWLTNHNEQLKTFELKAFVLVLLRRIQSLIDLYQIKKTVIDERALLSLLDEDGIQIKNQTTFLAVNRFSFKQKAKVPIGGFVGPVEISGLPKELIFYIELGSLCHVGKKTTVGNGRYTIEGLS